MSREIMQALTAPFDPSAVRWRVGSTTQDKAKGMALAYINARAVMDRLDEAVGCDCWSDDYTMVGPILICKLSLRIGGVWVSKSDGAGKTDVEAEKGQVSDALKRAAVKWGVGRYLYDLPSPWVRLDGKNIAKDEFANLRAILTRAASESQKPASNSAVDIVEDSRAQLETMREATAVAKWWGLNNQRIKRAAPELVIKVHALVRARHDALRAPT